MRLSEGVFSSQLWDRGQLTQWARAAFGWLSFPWMVIAIGVGLRVTQYLANRSLTFDESSLASYILNRSLVGLSDPLNDGLVITAAPLGFLGVEKLAVVLLGGSEYALRLFPLLAGIVSLPLFYGLAREFLKPRAALFGLTLFALSGPLIQYSSEVKQYESDMAFTLLILLVTGHVAKRGFTPRMLALYGVTGVFAIWFSHPAAFVLAGAGGSIALFRMLQRDWTTLGRLIVVYAVWLVSFLLAFVVITSDVESTGGFARAIGTSGYPFPPTSPSDVIFWAKRLIAILRVPGEAVTAPILGLLFAIGFISLLLRNRERLFLLLLPIVITYMVAGLNMYSLQARHLLFFIPLVLIIVAAGIEYVGERGRNRSMVIGVGVLGLLVLSLLLPVTIQSLNRLGTSETSEEIQPVMRYLDDHYRDGDVVYVYYGALPALDYYSDRYEFPREPYILGVRARTEPERYLADLDQLRGNGRVWVLFSHEHVAAVDEVPFMLDRLDLLGTRLDSFEEFGASTYLYDLSRDAEVAR